MQPLTALEAATPGNQIVSFNNGDVVMVFPALGRLSYHGFRRQYPSLLLGLVTGSVAIDGGYDIAVLPQPRGICVKDATTLFVLVGKHHSQPPFYHHLSDFAFPGW
jgi:hypothetical protein